VEHTKEFQDRFDATVAALKAAWPVSVNAAHRIIEAKMRQVAPQRVGARHGALSGVAARIAQRRREYPPPPVGTRRGIARRRSARTTDLPNARRRA
jgi:hypothetical protein